MTDPLVKAIRWAADTLDREEHRYVERFAPCPNGCVYGYADGFTVAGEHRSWPTNQVPMLAKIAGPDDCDLCDDGTIEDDDAPWINDDIQALRAAADRLAGLEARAEALAVRVEALAVDITRHDPYTEAIRDAAALIRGQEPTRD